MRKPVYTIIIPVFGRIEFTRQAIHSVLRQTVPHDEYEIIIVEEKNYRHLIRHRLKKEFPSIITVENKFKEGPGGSRQTGLNIAHGKFICFLDSDDQLRPQYLQEMMTVLNKDLAASAVICLSESFFEKGFQFFERIKLYPLMFIRDIGLIWGYIFNNKYIYLDSFYLCQISHILFKFDLIQNLTFNYDFRRGGEDWDFIIQAEQNGPLLIHPKRLLKFRYSPNSSTDNPLNRERKWESYDLLAQRFSQKWKTGIFYRLFLRYINTFRVNS